MSDLPERIREAVKSHGLSTSAMARELGVSEGTLRYWMKGGSEPRCSDIITLSRITKASLLWLLIGEGDDCGADLDRLQQLEERLDRLENTVDQLTRGSSDA